MEHRQRISSPHEQSTSRIGLDHLGPTKTYNLRCHPSRTAEPGQDIGRAERRQVQASKKVPGFSQIRDRIKSRRVTMVRTKYIYWCINHRQHLDPKISKSLLDANVAES